VEQSSGGFREVDPAAAAGPAVVREYRAPWNVTWLHNGERHLYVGARDGLWVYEMSYSGPPVLVREYPRWKELKRIVGQGNLLYVIPKEGLGVDRWGSWMRQTPQQSSFAAPLCPAWGRKRSGRAGSIYSLQFLTSFSQIPPPPLLKGVWGDFL